MLYNIGVLKAYIVPGLVISIGNIEVGGTGKTPFSLALSEALVSKGYRVAIVTRGYKGKEKGVFEVTKTQGAEDVGDEALLMARRGKVPVIKAPDRVKGALYALRSLGAEIVILDDGFQHRRIYRDMDIVLVSRDLGREHLIPLGHLREYKSSLNRANILIYTKGLKKDGITAHLSPKDFTGRGGKIHDLSLVTGRSVLAFCGIARPQPFFDALERLGAEVHALTFRDHYLYTKKDIERIKFLARERDLVVTTEKDMVKLDRYTLDERWYALRVEMMVEGMDEIMEEIEQIVKARRVSR